MAKYTGYVDIPHATYDEWRNATLGNGYDIDGSYGCQCWDFASEFWRNVGFPIACVVAMFWMWDREREEHKAEAREWAEALNNNTAVMQKLVDRLEEVR